jgi:hypothetical protein
MPELSREAEEPRRDERPELRRGHHQKTSGSGYSRPPWTTNVPLLVAGPDQARVEAEPADEVHRPGFSVRKSRLRARRDTAVARDAWQAWLR